MSANKPGFYGKFIILTNGLDEETAQRNPVSMENSSF
jgi:hypothetical protein